MEDIEIVDGNDNHSFSVLKTYGDDLTARKYITNPAIARESEIKKLILTLLTPEKSALLVGKPGIGKTAIVEGLAYLINKGDVPDALKGYKLIKLNSNSLTGKITVGNREEMALTLLVAELMKAEKTIIFIDEIHTLIGNSNGSMDLANMLKPGLDRGQIKAIGATTTIEYDTYIVRDRAFLRRFEKIVVEEPDEAITVQILLGTLPKIERQTGIKFRYNNYVAGMLIESIVSATTEFKRVYGLSAMYPDVAFSVLTQAFSHALFQNKQEVTIEDVYNAIKTSKRIYPDSIVKELNTFRIKFKDVCTEEGITLPIVTVDEIQSKEDIY
jgi:ATP-dependent Clp protease ATP-binding subunit ClpA